MAGFFAGAALAFALSKGQPLRRRIIETIGGAVGGFLAAHLPDLAEPADSPNHRGFFHGLLFNVLLIVFFACMLSLGQSKLRAKADHHADLACEARTPGPKLRHWSAEFFFRFLAGAAAGAWVGYGSHVALDAFTPRSLPLIA